MSKLPIFKSKSVVITGALSIASLLYKAIDAASNAEFVWQKLGLNENAARVLGSSRTIDFMVAISLLGLVVALLYQANRGLAFGIPPSSTTGKTGVGTASVGPHAAINLAPRISSTSHVSDHPDWIAVTIDDIVTLYLDHMRDDANRLFEAKERWPVGKKVIYWN